MDVGAAGAGGAHLAAEVLDGFVHAGLELPEGLFECGNGGHGWHVRLPRGIELVIIKETAKHPHKRSLCGATLYALTSDPTFSPMTTRRMLPCLFMLKTTMGRLLSRQRLMAVASITLRPRFRMSR